MPKIWASSYRLLFFLSCRHCTYCTGYYMFDMLYFVTVQSPWILLGILGYKALKS